MTKSNTLRGRISILLVSSLTGITILIGGISFFSTRSNFKTLLEERATTIIETIGPTLELGLYAENLALLETLDSAGLSSPIHMPIPPP